MIGSRRNGPASSWAIAPFRLVDGLTADPARNLVVRDGREIPVEPRVMELLVYLATHAGRIVSKRDLMERVWAAHVVDEAVHRAVSLLRSALGDTPQRSTIVETIPRHGYRLRVLPVPLGRPEKRTIRLVVAAAAAGLVLLALPLLLLIRSDAAQPPAPKAAPVTERSASLPVLPALAEATATPTAIPSNSERAPERPPRQPEQEAAAPEPLHTRSASAESQPAPKRAPSAPRAPLAETPVPPPAIAPAPEPN